MTDRRRQSRGLRIVLCCLWLGLAGASAPAVAAAPDRGTWPHTVAGEAGSATIYQPQVISWPERQALNARVAIGITPNGAKAPILGTIDVAFARQTDLARRSVALTDAKLVATRFPSADTAQATRFEAAIKRALANMGEKRYPLDTVLLWLPPPAEKPAESAVKNDPPAIFFSDRPASLVVFDGRPVLAPVAGTPLSFAVNTNWDVFNDADGKRWYLLNNGIWLTAPEANGPWTPTGVLPPAFAALPADASFAEVRAQVPPRPYAGHAVPAIFVATTPAEIIVTAGPPKFVAGPVPVYYPYPYSYAGAVYYDPANGAWARGGAVYGPYGGVAKAGTAYNPATGAWAHGGAVYGPNGGAGAVSAYNPGTGSYVHGSAA